MEQVTRWVVPACAAIALGITTAGGAHANVLLGADHADAGFVGHGEKVYVEQ
ncbi:hypothetical protein [Streptomyces sp. S.PNR 29]|uniref:hypothetical protein n=1 Tax=Streptomyces sp. S.PNR 29 TaxID=2973805 RepID=UPI0025B04BDA|nr:hypothetical protein [Streptomyces sp. S.PNR 29]MDN0200003.1 hypothetical protein [Streptomyces sp. S.PNR 29]